MTNLNIINFLSKGKRHCTVNKCAIHHIYNNFKYLNLVDNIKDIKFEPKDIDNVWIKVMLNLPIIFIVDGDRVISGGKEMSAFLWMISDECDVKVNIDTCEIKHHSLVSGIFLKDIYDTFNCIDLIRNIETNEQYSEKQKLLYINRLRKINSWLQDSNIYLFEVDKLDDSDLKEIEEIY